MEPNNHSQLKCDEHTRYKFLDEWLSTKVHATADMISVAELTEQLFEDGKASGITSSEIEEGTGSVYEAILDAIMMLV
ncbi:DUF768 domain-containing protein [Mesorhizobium sp. B2-3-7]|nr:DUF768 domain-containing protein [Mesorhizobium sp. B2-3-8]TPM19161.1 DUF768 domain-containing protein [Mesorhizobium sp. B2-3-7]TPN71231.1 DUF768 domain-containing protein [Mesorhizobium sp. B1-1-1]